MTRTASPPQQRLTARVKAARQRIRSTRAGRIALKIGVGTIGVSVIVVGIVLLPLPGPGWLIIFAGLGIMATEFEWAARLLRFARAKLSNWTRWLATQGRGVQVLVGAAGFVVLAVAFAGAWWLFTR